MIRRTLLATVFVAFSVVFCSYSVATYKPNTFINLYEKLQLGKYGLNKEALDYALTGYQKLLTQGVVNNSRYLTIIDFTQSLFSKRFYIIDLENPELVVNTYVMHGKRSGGELAEKFSNKENSHQSSLGFFLTKYTYIGRRGYSLRLSGVEKDINTNVEKRGVVIHGSKYINEERAQVGKVERSEGCPALPKEESKEIINMIKDGSVVFQYHPSEEYLNNSSLL